MPCFATNQIIYNSFFLYTFIYCHAFDIFIYKRVAMVFLNLNTKSKLKRRSFNLLTFLLLFTFGHAQNSQFTDVTSALGLDYSYGVGLEYQYGLTSFNGGFSLCDFNEDGLDDLAYGSVAGMPIFVFENEGTFFNQVPSSSLPIEVGLSSSLTWVDYDNDGDKDLYLTNISGVNKLYRNEGAQNFTDVTISSGMWQESLHAYSVTWGDYNRDGWLDCYVVNRDLDRLLMGMPPGSPNSLFKNNGDGTFEEVAEELGVLNPSGLGYAVVFMDYNNDGWPDLYIGNDKGTCNKLYKNNGDGTFSDVSEPNTTGQCMNAMGICVGDYDNNGYLDMYVTNGPGGNKFYQNNGDETFTELGESLGITVGHNGWGTSFEDFDNDGDEDLFAVNGGSSIVDWQRNKLFYNQGDNTFAEDLTDSITLFTYHTYGSSMGDWNNDGYYDLAVMNVGGDPMKFWQNKGGSNNWIKLNFQGTVSNRDAIGTWVEVWTAGEKRIRYTMCGNSFSAQYSENYIVGIGQHETVDSIIVKWPSGIINGLYDLTPNQNYFIVEDTLSTITDCSILYYPDQDGDGYGDTNITGVANCHQTIGMVNNNLDCNDNDSGINPDASEICDGLDNDCNSLIDENLPLFTFYRDSDNDGFGDLLTSIDTCQDVPIQGYVDNDLDCNDSDNTISPDGIEIPNNGIDEDCNGEDLLVGVNNLSNSQTVHLFPNPVKSDLIVQYQSKKDLTLQLFDYKGQLIKTQLLPSNKENATIAFNAIPKGIYWVIVSDRDSGGYFFEKVIRI